MSTANETQSEPESLTRQEYEDTCAANGVSPMADDDLRNDYAVSYADLWAPQYSAEWRAALRTHRLRLRSLPTRARPAYPSEPSEQTNQLCPTCGQHCYGDCTGSGE